MSLLEDLTATTYKAPHKHPSKKWTPGVDTEKGEAVMMAHRPIKAKELVKSWDKWLEVQGLDPRYFGVQDDTMEYRTWQQPVGHGKIATIYYYKCKLVRRRPPDNDISQLITQIKKHRPAKVKTTDGSRIFVVALADWQLGKRDFGGTESTVRRVLALADQVAHRIEELGGIGELWVLGMGDIVEGCVGFYPDQLFNVELDRREQVTVARRLILKLLQRWTPLVPKMRVAALQGNHGENRVGKGQMVTTLGDNDDIACFEQVMDICNENPDRYGHIEWLIPKNEIAIAMDTDWGYRMAATHGHMGSGGAGTFPAQRVWQWHKNMAHAKDPVGDAHLVVCAHYHHLTVVDQGAVTLLQAPSLDPGSEHYSVKQGYHSKPGTLTFTISENGWGNLAIL